eukprot:SAG31_NODE_43832_length_265_cov_0.915663_1_plen_39_part_01
MPDELNTSLISADDTAGTSSAAGMGLAAPPTHDTPQLNA